MEALTVIGVLLLQLSCIMALCFASAGSQSQLLTHGAPSVFAGAIAFTFALAIFGVKDKDNLISYSEFNAGLYLGIVAAVLGFLSSVAIFGAKRAEGYGPF